MKIYNKLVRDKIPEIIESKGESCTWHVADDKEYIEKLKAKLQEEVSEFLEEDNNVEEVADILEVLYALSEFRGVTLQELEKIRRLKVEKKDHLVKELF